MKDFPACYETRRESYIFSIFLIRFLCIQSLSFILWISRIYYANGETAMQLLQTRSCFMLLFFFKGASFKLKRSIRTGSKWLDTTVWVKPPRGKPLNTKLLKHRSTLPSKSVQTCTLPTCLFMLSVELNLGVWPEICALLNVYIVTLWKLT